MKVYDSHGSWVGIAGKDGTIRKFVLESDNSWIYYLSKNAAFESKEIKYYRVV